MLEILNLPESFNARKSRNERLLESAIANLAKAERRLQELESEQGSRFNYVLQQGIENAKSDVAKLAQLRYLLEAEKILLRKEVRGDVDYRKRLVTEFLANVRKIDKRIKFHGTSLLHVIEILKSGQLISSQEQGLGRTSYDMSGHISVTDKESIGISIRDYINIKDRFLPLGCIFVIDPGSNVYDGAPTIPSLSLNDQQLINILCSPEVMPILKRQLRKFGYSENLAVDFFDFLKE
ncbi:MAG: hypothetical protein IT416_03175 [Candidatus Pacebacteria bacterium]|nr:hypothetical protein [Candidatus Paceibacterota bacterium]